MFADGSRPQMVPMCGFSAIQFARKGRIECATPAVLGPACPKFASRLNLKRLLLTCEPGVTPENSA